MKSQLSGIELLLKTLVNKFETDKYKSKLIFSDVIEEEIHNICRLFEKKNYKNKTSYR